MERYNNDVPLVLRLLGCWGIEGNTLRCRWGELNFNWGLALSYSIYHETAHVNIHAGPLNLFFKAPVLIKFRDGTEDWNASYGVSIFARDMHLNWRTACKVIYFPWDWTHARTTILKPDGSVLAHEEKHDRTLGSKDWHDRYDRWNALKTSVSETHSYHYLKLPSGEVQARTATIHGGEMEWRMRWFKWLPWPRKISRTIDITFDDEVGERSGSWKGGCTGCSWEWRHGETMLQALRRMERERRFR